MMKREKTKENKIDKIFAVFLLLGMLFFVVRVLQGF